MGNYIGMGAQIAGSEISGWAALLEQQAMLEAIQQEMARQRYFANQSYGGFVNALPQLGAESATKQLGQASAARQGQYQDANVRPLALGQAGTGPTAADVAQTRLAGTQRANLGAYGDVFANRAIAQDQMQDLINRWTERARGNASVFPYSLNAAQHSQDLLGGIGNALSSLGGSGINWSQYFGSPSSSQVLQGAYGSPSQQNVPYYDGGQGGAYSNVG